MSHALRGRSLHAFGNPSRLARLARARLGRDAGRGPGLPADQPRLRRAGRAPTTDPNIQNAWGISFGPGTPLWVSNQGTNTATLYNAPGVPQALVVSIPTTATGPQGPTGQVFNSTPDFMLGDGAKALFIFANENGTIYAWNGGEGTKAVLAGTGPAGA